MKKSIDGTPYYIFSVRLRIGIFSQMIYGKIPAE